MPMKTFGRRERTAAKKESVTFNASGTWPIPYGKGIIKASGKGKDGTPYIAGTYWYDNSSYTPSNPTPPTYTAGNPTPPTYTAGNPTPPTYTAGSPTPPSFSHFAVYRTYVNNTSEFESYNSYNSASCPSPTSAPGYYTYYSCSAQYTANPPNAATYNNNPPNASYYANNPPNAPYYANNPPNAASYYAGNVVNYANTPATTGAPAVFLTQTFPGGVGGPATPINGVVMYVPFSNTAAPVTAPSGSYVNIEIV